MATGLGRQCTDMATSVHHMIAMQAFNGVPLEHMDESGSGWKLTRVLRNMRKLYTSFFIVCLFVIESSNWFIPLRYINKSMGVWMFENLFFWKHDVKNLMFTCLKSH